MEICDMKMNESQLKDKMYFGEMSSFKKQLQNIEWNNL